MTRMSLQLGAYANHSCQSVVLIGYRSFTIIAATCIHRISLDTLLWNEKLLEDRLTELNAWTRRSPPTQRQKLARINLLLKRCNNN